MDFNSKLLPYVELINKELDKYMPATECQESGIYTSMRYSLLSGGKRLRPILALIVGEIFGAKKQDIIPFACALEMIHTYSLIHDDLPAMDNDDLRRGKPANHIIFGEATAILAGDGLLNSAFEIMINEVYKKQDNIRQNLLAMKTVAECSGVKGMIAGQFIDINCEDVDISLELLEYMHERKTGCLIEAAILCGAYIGNANEDEVKSLKVFAENLGIAFQIRDDILDVVGNTKKTGKNIGSDISNKKSTFIKILGLEKAQEVLKQKTDEAIKVLEVFGERAEFLKNLAEYLLVREY